MAQFDINENGVKKQLEELNIHKSVGPDDLSPHLLKMLAPEVQKANTFTRAAFLGSKNLHKKCEIHDKFSTIKSA